ncbi:MULTISPECIES: RagB/SusD family nutrient uptake outer membrane protein [unclassified Carboxylicivirga]|uniref:RagB/SusD family nutrient uptake outer membrane protein n=1 Tax=Carboxylicivirga TaxID=1628153 RepID=UPI003D33C4C1
MRLLKYISKNVAIAVVSTLMLSSCLNELDQLPIDPTKTTGDQVYQTEEGYERVVAKVYAALALTGQEGPAGNGDVGGIDEGSSSFIRNLWNAQVLTTDEAICAWGDFGISQLNQLQYSAANPFIEGLYYRIYHQVSMANEFLRQSTDDKLAARGQEDIKENIHAMRAEVRFLRAYAYAVAIDVFGSVPFVTEADGIGTYLPEQISRKDLFDWVIDELDAIESDITPIATADYGRVDAGAVAFLKARLYLNAQVYTGTPQWDAVITETKKLIDAYDIYEDNYQHLFYADNNNSSIASGFIFAVPYDGDKMQTYGGTSFLCFSSTGGGISPDAIGLSGGWGGNRARPQLIDLFQAGDRRGYVDGLDGTFFDSGAKEIENPALYSDGFGVMKYRNINSDGSAPSNKDFVTTDFPLFRLADAYLMYAEAVVKEGQGGDKATAVSLINKLRMRAFGNASGNITQSNLTADFILDERGRELYWECTRRSDLIRYNKYTSNAYLWAWKGGVPSGAAVSATKRLFAIPAKDIGANSNLVQNPGY